MPRRSRRPRRRAPTVSTCRRISRAPSSTRPTCAACSRGGRWKQRPNARGPDPQQESRSALDRRRGPSRPPSSVHACSAMIVALGDQPRLPSDVIPALREAFERTGQSVIAPVYRGTQGTPVLFGADVVPELRSLTGDAGARSVVRRDASRVELVSFDLPMPLDVDTPEDYARLV